MYKYITILIFLSFQCSSLVAQELSDFKSPKTFIKFTNNEGTYDIESKIQYNGESFLLYVNNKLEVILTDLLFIRNQVTEGANCKAYHATCTTDKKRYLILFAEKAQFFLVKMDGDEFVFLSNKGVIDENESSSNFGNSCYHTNLSTSFNLRVKITRKSLDNASKEISSIYIFVEDKETGIKLETLEVIPDTFFDLYNVFGDCSKVSSYSTNKFMNEYGYDGFFGDIIVADFNFDGLDDIAIVKTAGNSGERYNFYVQKKEKTFILDNFLTETVKTIPKNIDFENKKFITYQRLGAWGYKENTFRYNNSQAKWEVKTEIKEH